MSTSFTRGLLYCTVLSCYDTSRPTGVMGRHVYAFDDPSCLIDLFCFLKCFLFCMDFQLHARPRMGEGCWVTAGCAGEERRAAGFFFFFFSSCVVMWAVCSNMARMSWNSLGHYILLSGIHTVDQALWFRVPENRSWASKKKRKKKKLPEVFA